MRRTRRPTGPGELLLEHYVKPNGLSVTAFAKALGVSRGRLGNVLHRKGRVDPSLAARIGRTTGTSTELWLNAQKAVDLFDAEEAYRDWNPLAKVPKQSETPPTFP